MSAHADDDLTCFRRAMAEGDARHAAHHLAGIVAEGATDAAKGAVDELVAACDARKADLLELAPLGENVYFGVVILRAIFLARLGRGHEGLPFVLRAQAVVPDLDLVAWTDGWLTDPVVAAIDIDAVVQGAFKIESHRPYTERVVQMLERIRKAREPHGSLALATARLVRMTGDYERAIAIAEDSHRRGPSYFTCVARGAAYRECGKLAEAIAAYEEAVVLEPNDDAVRLDIGDLSLMADDPDRAARAYAEVLTKDPRHEWAWPSQLYILALEGDEAARDELGRLSVGGNHRAQSLYAKIEPFVLDLDPPSASCINSANDAVARGYTPSALAISSMEPPSALATFREVLAAAGKPTDVSITMGEVASPDPRVARAKVEWQIWSYERDGVLEAHAHPALPAPRADVAAAIGEIAATRYEPSKWSASARLVAAKLGEGAARDVLATMAFPPAAPDGAPPGDWRFRVQVAAAFVACRLGSSTGDRAAHALVNGPIDWTTTAAIVALTELARDTPERASHVIALLAPLVEPSRSPIHFGCVVSPVVHCILRITGLPDDVRDLALSMRRDFDSRG